MNEIGAHHFVLGVAENVFEISLAGIFHCGGNFCIARALLSFESEVHHTGRRRGNAEGHPAQLTFHRRANKAHRFGGAGAGGDDVDGGGAAIAPRFAAGAVHGFLRGGVGVDGGHQTLGNAEAFLEQHVHHGREAIGGTAGVGNNVMILCVVLVIVHAHHHGQILAFGGGTDNDFLRAGFEVSLRFFGISEQAGGFDHHIDAQLFPRQLGRSASADDFHFIAIDDERIVALMCDLAGKRALRGIIFNKVREIIRRDDIAHCDDVDRRAHESLFHHRAVSQPANPPETINCNFDSHSIIRH